MGEESNPTARPQKPHLQERSSGEPRSPTDPASLKNLVRAELQWDIPMSVPLPIEVISADQPFPFLDTTLADLGIEESAVKERVVWVDTKRTQVKNKAGKLKEKEITILENIMSVTENSLQPMEMTMALEIESQPKQEIREV